MSIQNNYTTKMGFNIPEAYTRITQFTGNKNDIMVYIETYFNAEARANKQQSIIRDSIKMPLRNGSSMQQMYDELKKLPQFKGAIDV